MQETLDTLKKLLSDSERQLENCDVVIDLMKPQMDAFNEKETSLRSFNQYAVRIAVDHISERRRSIKKISAFKEAIKVIEQGEVK